MSATLLPSVSPAHDDDEPRTRLTDPITSHEAADSNDVIASEIKVLSLFARLGDSTDFERFAHYEENSPVVGRYSAERMRSARSKLEKKYGYVEPTGEKRKTPSGKNAGVYRLTETGAQVAADLSRFAA